MKNEELLKTFYQGLFDEIMGDIAARLPESDEVLEAITEGVDRAVWRMITNATDMPCADFYHHVQKGVEKALEGLDIDSLTNLKE